MACTQCASLEDQMDLQDVAHLKVLKQRNALKDAVIDYSRSTLGNTEMLLDKDIVAAMKKLPKWKRLGEVLEEFV